MAVEIAASVLNFSFLQLADDLAALEQAGVDWVHWDVMDGQFVPSITFGDAVVRAYRPVSTVPFEVHLMTSSPERQVSAFVDAGCARVIFQAEATLHAYKLCEEVRSLGAQVGVAINPGTPVEALRPLLPVLDLALIMTVNPGRGGQPLIVSCLDKVRAVRSWAPDIAIEVDGGIDDETASLAIEAGANVLVAGQFLAGAADRAAALARLRASCVSKS